MERQETSVLAGWDPIVAPGRSGARPDQARMRILSMRGAALIFGTLLVIATFVWFMYFVPLGCAMNTTGCRETFSVWSGGGLVHFWAPLLVAGAAILFGLSGSR